MLPAQPPRAFAIYAFRVPGPPARGCPARYRPRSSRAGIGVLTLDLGLRTGLRDRPSEDADLAAAWAGRRTRCAASTARRRC